MEKEFDKIILRPVVSEKCTFLQNSADVYCFEVHPDATKHDIKNALQKMYSIHIVHINMVNINGKVKKRRFIEGKKKDWKKAYVKLKKGEKLPIFEGV
ncbi:MAG: 50S ribosomal protein L23 [Spirochaetes bacterium]|nr:50S ribosomal protein L23 [Spirochaetota bacterium]